jgi:hypothetical protein
MFRKILLLENMKKEILKSGDLLEKMLAWWNLCKLGW